MIEVHGLCKRIGSRQVLDGVSFTVAAGQVFGLVGANGSGKTTVLRILATLESADEGEVAVAGASIAGDPERVRASVGFAPGSFGVYPRLTAEEYLEFYAGIQGVARSHRRRLAGELLGLVGLGDHRHEDADSLSPGHRQRLGLARALVHDPDVLLLDDVSSLDVEAQGELQALLAELRAMDKTAVVAGVQADTLARLCTSVGLLEHGRMATAVSLDDLLGGGARKRRFVIGVAEDAGSAALAAEGHPGVVSVEVSNDRIEVTAEESCVDHELLARLVSQGVKVRSLMGVDPELSGALRRHEERGG